MATITRNYDRPVTNHKRLGGVPRDRYESTWWPNFGEERVTTQIVMELGSVPAEAGFSFVVATPNE